MFEREPLFRPRERQLPKPGIFGRVGRFLVGIFALSFLPEVLPHTNFLVKTPPSTSSFNYFFGVAIAFWLLPDVVNIGFNIRWGRRSQQLFLWLAAVAIVADLVYYGALWGPPLGWLVLSMSVFTLGYLGLSHVLAALIGTPGCEMRAIPHLWAMLRGESVEEVVCPGHWDWVDKVETGSKQT
jgi:hypothetical protein